MGHVRWASVLARPTGRARLAIHLYFALRIALIMGSADMAIANVSTIGLGSLVAPRNRNVPTHAAGMENVMLTTNVNVVTLSQVQIVQRRSNVPTIVVPMGSVWLEGCVSATQVGVAPIVHRNLYALIIAQAKNMASAILDNAFAKLDFTATIAVLLSRVQTIAPNMDCVKQALASVTLVILEWIVEILLLVPRIVVGMECATTLLVFVSLALWAWRARIPPFVLTPMTAATMASAKTVSVIAQKVGEDEIVLPCCHVPKIATTTAHVWRAFVCVMRGTMGRIVVCLASMSRNYARTTAMVTGFAMRRLLNVFVTRASWGPDVLFQWNVQ